MVTHALLAMLEIVELWEMCSFETKAIPKDLMLLDSAHRTSLLYSNIAMVCSMASW